MMNSIKDAMTAKAAQVYLNNQVARYGRLLALKIDSQRKTMEITGQLNGETAPVTVQVGRYVVEAVGGKTFLSIAEFSCSRPWLQNALEDFVKPRRVELPAWAATAL